jgi:transglutaminase-like putative cysteine protease
MPPAHTLLRRCCASLALVAAAFAGADEPAPYRIAPAPAWVVPVAAPTTAADDGEAVDLLLDDSQSSLVGVHTSYSHRAVHPNNAAGVDQTSEIRINFNPDYQTLTLHSIVLIRNGEKRELVRTATIRMLRREQSLEQGIHDNVLTANIILDDVRAGDTIDYSYTLQGFNPIFGNRQFGWIPINSYYPVQLLTARVITPARRPLNIRVVNDSVAFQKKQSGDTLEYTVRRENVPAIPQEDRVPNWYMTYAALEYSEYASWAEVQDWANALYRQIDAGGDAVRREAEALRKASSSDEDFVTRTLFFVQNEIRYEGLELGSNSHLPHTPGDVLKNRYGDCKDKSLLLTRLLAEGGISARPAMVSSDTGKGIANDVPSPASFDHVIARVDLKGKTYWLDSTRLYQAGTLAVLGNTDYGYALVVNSARHELERMYEKPPLSYQADVVSHYHAHDFTSPVRLDIDSTFQGNAADFERYRFKAKSPKDIDKEFTGFLAYFYPGIRSASLPQIDDDPAADRVVLHEHYEIPHYWQPMKDKLENKIILQAFMDTVPYPKQVNRQAPYALPSPRVITTTTYFHYPMDVGLEGADPVKEFSFQGLSFHGRDHYQDSTYIHRGSLVVSGDHVDPADMVEYAGFVKALDKEAEFSMYQPSPALLGYPEVSALKARLKVLTGGKP